MNGQTVLKAFVPLPGGATAVYSGSTLGWYRHADWLGSSRLATTSSGALYYDGAYAPFGETMGETGTADRSFTGQNQDLTAYLYDFPYREYDATRGRWLSPDPAGLAAADPANPQSWNRYGYVNGSPLNLVDPLGLWTPTPGSGGGSSGGFTGGSDPGGFPMSPNCQQVFWSLSSSIFRGFIDTSASAVLACVTGLQQYRPGPGSSSAGGDAGRESIVGKANGPSVPAPNSRPPIYCNAGFIKASNAAWMRAVNGLGNTEAGFWATGIPDSPVFVPLPYTNQSMTIT